MIPSISFPSRRFGFTSLALALALVSGARADTITLVDGKTLENVTIVNESLKDITYKQDGKSKTVASDTVASVDFKKKPKLVDQADSSAHDGDIGGAMSTLETYVGGLIDGNAKEPLAWAPPYAMQRLIELAAATGDAEEIVKAADRLIANAKDSRYLPSAYLNKATALYDMKQTKEALTAIADLRKLIDGQGLGQRWKLEADLAEALSDTSLGATRRRARVVEIAAVAGKDYPLVANRAKVAEGESYTEGDSKDFVKAMAIFRQIIADPSADAQTLAGAYIGLGDCAISRALDQQKANQDANATFKDAAELYMRVVVLYPEQTAYRAKAMYFAGRAFEFLGDDTSKSRARLLYHSVIREFKDSRWATDAKKQLGG